MLTAYDMYELVLTVVFMLYSVGVINYYYYHEPRPIIGNQLDGTNVRFWPPNMLQDHYVPGYAPGA